MTDDMALEQMASVMVHVGYPRADIDRALRNEYPADDDRIEEVLDRAFADLEEFDVSLKAAVAEDNARAVSAEHDLSESMHPDET